RLALSRGTDRGLSSITAGTLTKTASRPRVNTSWPCWPCSSAASCNPPPSAGDAHAGPSLQEGGGYASETRNTDPQSAEHPAARAALLEVKREAESQLAARPVEVVVGSGAYRPPSWGTGRRGRHRRGRRAPLVAPQK